VGLPGMEWLRDEIAGPSAKPRLEKVRRLKKVAEDLGCSRAQLAIAWCLKNPHVSTVITGATSRQQLVENLGALDVVAMLTTDVMATIDGIVGR